MKELLEYQKNIAQIQYTINLLRWELKISTPKKAEENIMNLISYYENKLFELQTSAEYGELLINATLSFGTIEEAEERYVINLIKHYNNNVNVPLDFYVKYTDLKNKSTLAWKEAKEKNNYELFKPYLENIVQMTKEYYRYIDKNEENLYDVMLNIYETGITSETIDKLFEELKNGIQPLILNLENKKQDSYDFDYSEDELIDCAKYLLDYIGFDMDKGMLGIYPHGFTSKICANDIRIAFKHTNNPFDFVTTIIHEGGHGIFEQNIKENLSKYENTTIDNLYALHESQSRFYENILGRNINFWIPIYDEIKKKLKLNMSLEEFMEKLNNPVPSLIRTEADELTYCMHIILRYEIEKDLFSDKITVDDIPLIWNKKMKEYLNVDVDVDTPANGLMQDIHWSDGSFGYFPSYLLGTIYDGMFIESIEKNLGNIDELLKDGRIKEITDYLAKNIYINGGAYTSIEILDKIYGKELSVEPIIKYFENKYSKDVKKLKHTK